jgi:hypothetical protein
VAKSVVEIERIRAQWRRRSRRYRKMKRLRKQLVVTRLQAPRI